MKQRALLPYPWDALELLDRAGWRRTQAAKRVLERSFDVARIARALGELIHVDAHLVVKRIHSGPTPPGHARVQIGMALDSVSCWLFLESELAADLLSRVLGRTIGLTASEKLDATLEGAICALVLETARRAGAAVPVRVLESPFATTPPPSAVAVDATLNVAGKTYHFTAMLSLPELAPEPRHVALGELGELVLSLPLVVGLSFAERALLGDFVLESAWFPGPGWWLDASGAGRCALAGAASDHGYLAELSPNGEIVLRGETVLLLPDAMQAEAAGEKMSDKNELGASTLTDAVLDSPVVVRVELGMVSMTAREWAELRPGDVIETGRRIAEPVVLRIAGREVARGELVRLEDELGVRIRELVNA